MNSPGKFHAWLATARIANVPSVISNVWLGIALGAYQWGGEDRTLLIKGGVLALAGVFLYLGGNFLNDWHDREWDAKHRPERALPAGLFSPLSYLLRAARFLLLGVVCAAIIGIAPMLVAVAIAALVIVYTRWHKKAVWPVIPMGLCRALLPVMGFLSILPDASGETLVHLKLGAGHSATVLPSAALYDWGRATALISLHASGLFCWIVGLSLYARYESIQDPPPGPRMVARAMLFLPLFAMGGWWMRWYPLFALLGAVPFLVWLVFALRRKLPVPVLVAALLAGIPLVEWIAAFPLALSQVVPGESALASPILATTLILPGVSFLLARRLQRVAAAT